MGRPFEPDGIDPIHPQARQSAIEPPRRREVRPRTQASEPPSRGSLLPLVERALEDAWRERDRMTQELNNLRHDLWERSLTAQRLSVEVQSLRRERELLFDLLVESEAKR